MKKVYLLPNVITAFALTCGLFVIFKMSMVNASDVNPRLLIELSFLLLLSATADLLDGAVARAMKAQSEFGGLFDSLADAITFGVAPSVVVLKSLAIPAGSKLSFFITAAAMVYTVCGVLRLVRYNLTNKTIASLDIKSEIMQEEEKPSKNFTGLPIPAAAASVFSANLLLFSNELEAFYPISDLTRTWMLFVVLVLIGYFMVSRWKFPSLKNLNLRVASFQVVFFTVITAVFVIYGLLNYFSVVFFAIAWGYLAVAWILSVARLIAGKKLKSLEDFEPEPEDEEIEV